MSAANPLAPVPEAQRLRALDATRGLALLGIFLVNIGSFAMPFGDFIQPAPGAGESALDRALWVAGKALWEGRFYPLFSMLFGMGLVIQWRRARHAGRGFVVPTIRRLGFLIVIGACHALAIWYGDILFMYGTIGLAMLFLVGRRPGTLLVIAGCLLAILLAIAGLSAVGIAVMERSAASSSAPADAPAAPSSAPASAGPIANPAAAPAADPVTDAVTDASSDASAESAPPSPRGPFERAMALYGERGFQGPSDPRWMKLEAEAFREGPWLEATLFRAWIWLWFLVFVVMGFGWHVLAMFCIGAALFKLDYFSPRRRAWHWTSVLVAAFVAVPLSVGSAIIQQGMGMWYQFGVASAVAYLLGPVISLGYLSAITLLVNGGVLTAFTSLLAAAGRMAFSNYLMQSLIATAAFHHWGFGLFGSFSRSERVLFVACVYAAQLVASVLWLRWFTMGPLEWIWRAVTYLRFVPIRRRPGATPDAGSG